MIFPRLAAVFFLLLALTGAAAAQDLPVEQRLGPRAAPRTHVQMSALPVMNTVPAFDAAKATDKYLARVSGEARARSDAYFEGGYWLQLVDLIYGLAVASILLWLQISSRISDWVEERTHSRTYQVMLYVAVYVPLTTLMTFPI